MDMVKGIVGDWYHVPTLMTFCYMMLSPANFFKKLDTVVMKEPDSDEFAGYPTSPHVIINGDSVEEIERDEKVLANIDKMIANAQTADNKQLWTVKRAEFARQMRWKRHSYYN